MEMPKPTCEDRARFMHLVPDDPRVEAKPMFGNLGAFVNGNMFMGLFGSAIGVKLAGPDLERLRKEGGGPFGPAERPMGGYVTLPPDWTPRKSKGWVDKALAHVAELPPKAKKVPAKKVKKIPKA
jgi:TfoX/Sxy family transcriptional regulator of competence genes